MFADPISPPPKQSFLDFLRSFSFWGAPLFASLAVFVFMWAMITVDRVGWFEHPQAVPDNLWLYFGHIGARLGFILGLPMAIGTMTAYFARGRRFPTWNRRDLMYALMATSLAYLVYTGSVFRVVFSLPYQLLGFGFASAWASKHKREIA